MTRTTMTPDGPIQSIRFTTADGRSITADSYERAVEIADELGMGAVKRRGTPVLAWAYRAVGPYLINAERRVAQAKLQAHARAQAMARKIAEGGDDDE